MSGLRGFDEQRAFQLQDINKNFAQDQPQEKARIARQTVFLVVWE